MSDVHDERRLLVSVLVAVFVAPVFASPVCVFLALLFVWLLRIVVGVLLMLEKASDDHDERKLLVIVFVAAYVAALVAAVLPLLPLLLSLVVECGWWKLSPDDQEERKLEFAG